MVHAYVAIITGTGSSPDVAAKAREIDGVTEAHVVTGAYDVVGELEVADVGAILDVVSAEVRTIEGVGATRTYISLD